MTENSRRLNFQEDAAPELRPSGIFQSLINFVLRTEKNYNDVKKISIISRCPKLSRVTRVETDFTLSRPTVCIDCAMHY